MCTLAAAELPGVGLGKQGAFLAGAVLIGILCMPLTLVKLDPMSTLAVHCCTVTSGSFERTWCEVHRHKGMKA